MSNRRFYVTTAIPYVNGDPHLGHALELVQADVLARHRRLRGDDVRFLSGTDDNALKNVDAALAAGRPVAEFVADKAERFVDLARLLQLSNDDFIRTSADPRHRPGVERLWLACAAGGDLYEQDYEGLYCRGCEAFVDGPCPEHADAPERVVERNWFFRLSRYQDELVGLLESGTLRVEPEHRRNEVLAFVRGGLTDFSVSRPHGRARGWGIPVPGDPTQVVYVWFDALANYVTALDGPGGGVHDSWWRGSAARLHVIGKGIVRFHAVYWPAILLSAGEPLPTAIFVHDYLTADGQKLSKSAGTAIDPFAVAGSYGADALRWWLLRDVPRAGDADVRLPAIAARANELADGLGNLVNRTIALAGDREPAPTAPPEGAALAALWRALPASIDDALGAFDLRAAAGALWEVVAAANRFVSSTRPWEAARPDPLVAVLLDTCRLLAHEVSPFLPEAAKRIQTALAERDRHLGRALFPKNVVPVG
jgi:methionyl-tRNA synthetase